MVATIVAVMVPSNTCICWHEHDCLFQAWNGPQQLHLILFFHRVGNAIRVDDIAVQTFGLKPYMMSAIGESSELGFQ